MSAGDAGERWMTTREVADMLRLSPKRVAELMRRGHLVEGIHYARPTGMHPRFRESALTRYLNGERVETIRRRGQAGVKVNPALMEAL